MFVSQDTGLLETPGLELAEIFCRKQGVNGVLIQPSVAKNRKSFNTSLVGGR